MARASLAGVEVAYRQVGAGSDVVLIHGLGASQAFWSLELIGCLARRFRVTAFDLRGHGYSETPTSGYRVADMAGDLHHLMEHLDIRRAHLVGHSWGGTIALRQAIEHPERVASLALVDSRVRALQTRQVLRSDPEWPRFLRMARNCGVEIQDDEPELGICLLDAVASPKWEGARRRLGGSYRFLPFAGRGRRTRTADRWLRLIEKTTAPKDLRAPTGISLDGIRAIRQPVLAIYGERSPNLMSLRRLTDALVDCRSEIVRDAGHYHPISQPRVFREQLLAFLSRGSAGT